MKKEKNNNKEKKEIWFKAKCYGWGWYPCTWQGWLVLLIWFVLFLFSVEKMDHEGLKNLIVIIILTIILIWISWKKGERPGWRWGCK